MTNTSQPRTLSANRGRISPLANSTMLASPSGWPRWAATSSANAGCVRPENRASFLVVTFSMWWPLPGRVIDGLVGSVGGTCSVERACHSPPCDRGTGGQMGERADGRTVADLGVDAHRVAHRAAAPDDAVGELRVRTQVGVVADDRSTLQDRARVDRDVAAELDGDVDERLARIEHGDAIEQPVAVGAVAELALGEGELPAVVDTLRLAGRGVDGTNAVAHRGEPLDHVGEVELGLRVVGREVAKGGAEQVAPERVDPHVRLLDVELVG